MRNTANATMTKLTTVGDELPDVDADRLPTWIETSLKFGWPKIAPMKPITMLSANDWTTVLNAAPTTTATARSITLPRRMNFLKSLRKVRTTLPLGSVAAKP